MSENVKLDVLSVFGYTPEDLNCANAETAISEIFDNEHNQNPVSLLELFIYNCSVEEFDRIKKSMLITN